MTTGTAPLTQLAKERQEAIDEANKATIESNSGDDYLARTIAIQQAHIHKLQHELANKDTVISGRDWTIEQLEKEVKALRAVALAADNYIYNLKPYEVLRHKQGEVDAILTALDNARAAGYLEQRP